MKSKLHPHLLAKKTEAEEWRCDKCSTMTGGVDRFSCEACDFDLCGACLEASIELQPTVSCKHHPHPLMLKQPRYLGWFVGLECDQCGVNQTRTTESYRCSEGCDYDLCVKCLLSSANGTSVSSTPSASTSTSTPAKVAPSQAVTSSTSRASIINYNGVEMGLKVFKGTSVAAMENAIRARLQLPPCRLLLTDEAGLDVALHHAMDGNRFTLSISRIES